MSEVRKTWFITGASSGFGHAFAIYALSKGHNVVATARNIARLEGLSRQAADRVLVRALDDVEFVFHGLVRLDGLVQVRVRHVAASSWIHGGGTRERGAGQGALRFRPQPKTYFAA